MRIENIKERIKSLEALVDIITLTPEEAERQNKEQQKIQEKFDNQYDW